MAATNDAKNMTTQKSVPQARGHCSWLAGEDGDSEPFPCGDFSAHFTAPRL